MKHVLVVGGAGYIGSHTCKTLHRDGYRITVLDNLSEGHRDFVKWGDLIEVDLRDRAALFEAVQQSGADAIIHFAAYAYVGESVRDPAKYWHNNVAGTINLADAAVSANIDKLVFSSTCATYGHPADGLPIREDLPQQPINPYGQTKLTAEKMLLDYGAATPLRSVCLRYFNAAGADFDLEIGENHNIETHLIPLAIFAAMGQTDGLQVFGDDYPTADGSAVRDYIHVLDLARAHVLALEYLEGGGSSDAFNLGIGRGLSVLEVIAAVEKVAGVAVPHKIAPRRPGDPPQLISDVLKARRLLGFDPRHSAIEDIVGSAWKWHKLEDAL